MVDFIKITNAGVRPETFLNNPLLSFDYRVEQKTGEINGVHSANYRGMRFLISRNGTPGLAGSLHKYYNLGLHNYDDFTLDKLIWVIKDLEQRFGIDPSKIDLNNVEFGVNLEVPYYPDDFIDSLVTYNYKQFNTEKEKTKTYSQVKQSQFILKIYNKGKQHQLNKNILRFEVKITRMAKLAKYEIRTLHDLMNPDKLLSIKSLLLDVFDNIIMCDDSIELTKLKDSEKEILHDGGNPKFWQIHKKVTGSNSSIKVRLYKNLIRKYGKNNYHSLDQLISTKCDSLLQNNVEPIRDITGINLITNTEPIRDITDLNLITKTESIRDITDLNLITKTESIRDITGIKENLEFESARDFTTSANNSCPVPLLPHSDYKPDSFTSSYNLSIGKHLISSNKGKKVCPVTGYNISMQNENSTYLSVTGIYFYYKYYPEIFQKLKEERLTSKWATSSLKEQIYEIAHSIRTSNYNAKKGIKKLCSSPALFNNYNLISDSKKRIANLL